MKKRESRSSITFRHWVRANADKLDDCSFEMKSTRGKDYFYLREFKEEQENYAEAITYGKKGVLIRTDGVKGLPDYIYIKKKPAYVIIKYPKYFVGIKAEIISHYKKTKLKSITLEQALVIAKYVIPYGLK